MPWRKAEDWVNWLTVGLLAGAISAALVAQVLAATEWREGAAQVERVGQQVRFAVNQAPQSPVEIPVPAPQSRTVEGVGIGATLAGALVLAIRLVPPIAKEIHTRHCQMRESVLNFQALEARNATLAADLEACRQDARRLAAEVESERKARESVIVQLRADHARELKHIHRDYQNVQAIWRELAKKGLAPPSSAEIDVTPSLPPPTTDASS